MGKRGPAPVPTEILRKRGSWRGEYANPNEPHAEQGVPECPIKLNKAAQLAWEEMTGYLDQMNVLCKVDANALARYCSLWAKWQKLDNFLEKNGEHYPLKDKEGTVIDLKTFPQVKLFNELTKELLKLEKEFGMTPSARSRIEAYAPEDNSKPEGKNISDVIKIG